MVQYSQQVKMKALKEIQQYGCVEHFGKAVASLSDNVQSKNKL